MGVYILRVIKKIPEVSVVKQHLLSSHTVAQTRKALVEKQNNGTKSFRKFQLKIVSHKNGSAWLTCRTNMEN